MPAGVPLKPTTVRFDHSADTLIEAAAKACGVSKSQFVRDAALVRAILVNPEQPQLRPADVSRVAQEAHRLASPEPGGSKQTPKGGRKTQARGPRRRSSG